MQSIDLKISKLSEIREKLAQFQGNLQPVEFLLCDTVPGGIPRGVICEVTGTARTEWLLRFLKQNPSLSTFWAETALTILPTAIQQRGIELDRILIAETGEKLFQTLRKALKSKLFDCVVLPGTIEETKIIKALQLFARESNACVFFLSRTVKNAWAIPFQLEANWNRSSESGPDISIQIIKSKFSHLSDDRLNRNSR